MKEYILELLRNNIYVFPIRGKGKDINEVKQPLTFFEGDEKITWKNEKILGYSEELARKGHYAWAVWLLKSQRFGIDIDLYKAQEELNIDIVAVLKDLPDIYSEMSARGGIHIVLAVPDDKKYKLVGTKKWVEWKHDGYFIIAPSILKTPEGEYRYTHIAGNLLETVTIDEWEFYKDLILHNIEAKIIPESDMGKVFEGEEVRIEGLKLDIDTLTDEQITALLYLLFNEANCEGMVKLMEWIGEHGIVPIRKQMFNVLRIPRTTRWLTYYALAGVLAWVGASKERVATWFRSWKYIDEDEDPVKDSIKNALYNVYHRQQLLLMPRGACPFCPLLLNKESCKDTPFHKVMRLKREDIQKLIDFVRRHVH